MTISSSLNAGVAGLAVNASRLSTISDNIANSATYGYKRATADFHSMLTPNSPGKYVAGGVRTTTLRLIDQGGPITSTTNSTDLAVAGRGFLPVTRDSDPTDGKDPILLATTGSFRPDEDGFLRSTAGLILMGWPATTDGVIPDFDRDSHSGLEPIRIASNQFWGEPTTKVQLSVNLPATATNAGADGSGQDLTMLYYDNLGKPERLSVTYTPTVPATGASNEWTMSITDSASGGAVVGEYLLTFSDDRATGGSLLSVVATTGGPYDPVTGLAQVNVAGGPLDIDLGLIGAPTGTTQLADTFAPTGLSKDGSPAGILAAVEVDPAGLVRAIFDTGASRLLYRVPLVAVPNANALQQLSDQTYAISPSSGDMFLWNAGEGPTGSIIGFAREESSTDISAELTQMIQTQRAYSSNAKIIQTVDEMLQETTNLKR